MHLASKLRGRLADVRRLHAAKRMADHWLATRPENGAAFHIAAKPFYHSLLHLIDSRLYNVEAILHRSTRRRREEGNRWVRSRIRDDGSGPRFHGDGFTLGFPSEFENAVGIATNDLREILLDNHYSCRFPYGRLMADDGVVLDCGANIGVFAISVATQYPTARVLAFEPEPRTHRTLCKNIELNHLQDRIEPFQLGLSDREGEFTFVCDERCFTQHRLDPSASSNAAGDPARDAPGVTRVRCRTIDRFVGERNLARCDLIKMDIEGAELEAIRGAGETIRRFRPRLTIASYHRSSDAYVLPLGVKDLCPDYNILVYEGNLFAFCDRNTA